MAEEIQSSVTVWLESLKSGDRDAAQKLWHRYFESLVRLARDRLRGSARAVVDEEDDALSAFNSFFRGAANGRYPMLEDRDDLWRLLVVITERKALDQARHERRQKRGGGKVRVMADGVGADAAEQAITCPEPTPEFAAMAADECRRLLALLRDQNLRQVAMLRMEGYTNLELADQLGCSLRSVARKIELIRRTWLAEVTDRS
jgi:DNA-directed RNA polymerase specialized sigma24 family protein